MKRQIVAGLAVLAVATGVAWKLSSHNETSTGLQDVSLNQHSEHAHAATTNSLARIRIRLMPDDLGKEIGSAHNVPHVSMATE